MEEIEEEVDSNGSPLQLPSEEEDDNDDDSILWMSEGDLDRMAKTAYAYIQDGAGAVHPRGPNISTSFQLLSPCSFLFWPHADQV